MQGKVLPAIAIQGYLLFESIMPQYEELIGANTRRAARRIFTAKAGKRNKNGRTKS